MPRLQVMCVRGVGACPEVLWTAKVKPYSFEADVLMFTLLLFCLLIIGGVAATLGWPEMLTSLS